MNKVKYYDIKHDLAAYPDAWCYLIWSKRGPGKTYSTLRYCIENKILFIFIKRTIEDVKMLCATSNNRKNIDFDVSPFVPLNRDFGWNIKPVKIEKGIAGFYNCNEDGEPSGSPIGYCVALSIASDIKGFDMSAVDIMIYDEFIPKIYERVSRTEGDALLDIYMTVSRDRIARGRDELKLICLANATSINNPVFNVLEVVDVAAWMNATNTELQFDNQRKIFLHKVPDQLGAMPKKMGIESAMEGTAWADMSFGGSFAYDDFSGVSHVRLKNYQPVCKVIYQRKEIYFYRKDGGYYATYSAGKTDNIYDLSRESEQRRFFFDYVGKFRDAITMDKMKFEKYTMYDLIFNYKKIFKNF